MNRNSLIAPNGLAIHRNFNDLKIKDMTAKDYREKENWNKADFFKGEYDIDLNSIDEYAEEYHQAKLKLLGIGGVSVSFLYEFVNEFTDTEIPKVAIKETLDRLNER